MTESTTFGPMAGLVVIEVSTYAAAPSTGAMLADWGADVIKIESLAGDPFRSLSRFGQTGEEYPTSQLDNRGKRSLSLDLKTEDGILILHELLAGADVFLTNMRLPALARMGLDDSALLARYPRLIYAILTGYGLEGPDCDRPAFDAGTWWGRAGVAMSVISDGAEPMFHAGGIGDHMTGLALAGGVAAALLARERTGRGQRVVTSMLRTGAFFLSSNLYNKMCGRTYPKQTRDQTGSVLVLPFKTGDGKWIYLLGMEGERSWQKLAEAVGHPEWLTDARYANAAARADNHSGLLADLDAIFARHDRAEWARRLDAAGMWWSPVQTIDDLPEDPQMRAAGCFVSVDTRWGTREMIPGPIDFSDTPWHIPHGSVALGADNEDILRRLGRSEDNIASLRAKGVIR